MMVTNVAFGLWQMPMPKRTPIGGLLLEAVDGWSFSVRDGTVAARRGMQPGVLRLTKRSPDLEIGRASCRERV